MTVSKSKSRAARDSRAAAAAAAAASSKGPAKGSVSSKGSKGSKGSKSSVTNDSESSFNDTADTNDSAALYTSLLAVCLKHGDSVPQLADLQRIHADISTLIANADNRLATCNNQLVRLKRIGSTIKQHQAKRAKLRSEEDEQGEEDEVDVESDTNISKPEETDVLEDEVKQEQDDDEASRMDIDLVPPKRESVDPDDVADGSNKYRDPFKLCDITALNLFKEDPLTPEVETDPDLLLEYRTKKYAVSTFPESDLKDLLPGEIPDQDYTRAKPAHQVQFATFATFIEPFFRPFNEEDMSFLKQRAVGLDTAAYTGALASPYFIPPLGPLYTETWAEEDGPNAGYAISPPPSKVDALAATGGGSADIITDEILDSSTGAAAKLACGPLTSRLLSALLFEPSGEESEDATNNYTNGKAEGENGSVLDKSRNTIQSMIETQGWKISSSVPADYATLEERLKREFSYVGILDMNILRREEKKRKRQGGGGPGDSGRLTIDWINGTEDDEVCYEMRSLQKKFRHVTKVNQASKRRLLPVLQDHMAYQEYTQILEDLDKQVDQAYIKRLRSTPKIKKKKGGNHHGTPQPSSSIGVATVDQHRPGIRALLEKRTRWINKIGPCFPPAEIMKRTPAEPMFENLQLDDDDEEEEEDDDALYG